MQRLPRLRIRLTSPRMRLAVLHDKRVDLRALVVGQVQRAPTPPLLKVPSKLRCLSRRKNPEYLTMQLHKRGSIECASRRMRLSEPYEEFVDLTLLFGGERNIVKKAAEGVMKCGSRA